MAKKLFITFCLAVTLIMALALITGAVSTLDEIDYDETFTLSDGTVLPIYDGDKNPLIWYVKDAEASGMDKYASVPTNRREGNEAKDDYAGFNINSMYGDTQLHDIYVNRYDEAQGKYVRYNEDSVVFVLLNLRELNYKCVGSISSNFEAIYYSETILEPGRMSNNKTIRLIDMTVCSLLSGFPEQTFSGCSNLKEFRFPSRTEKPLELVCKNNNIFNSTALESVVLPNTVTTIGQQAFYNCKSLKTFILPQDTQLTTIAASAFHGCSALTGVYELPTVTLIEDGAFRSVGTNEDTYLVFKLPNIQKIGSGSWDSHTFTDSGLCEIYIGNKLTHLSLNSFTRAKKLWKFEMADVINGFNFPSYTFEDCTGLVAFSIPEGITSLPGRMFKSCSNLKAVYLPSTLTKISSGSQDHATFANCINMYFVSQPFTLENKEDIPAKEDIYYFPQGITDISGGEVFKVCRSLNKTLVFGTGVTKVTNAWAFEAGIDAPTLENIVFLGDMEAISCTYWKLTGKIYFANSADLSKDNVTISGNKSFVFCNAADNTTHLIEKEMSTEANCDYPKMIASYCFCGAIVGTPITDGEALGHKFDAEAVYTFTTLLISGEKSVACTREGCDGKDVTVLNPILVNLGYSVCTMENNKSFTNGYMIDNDLLMKYEEVKGVTVTLGFAFNSVATFTNSDVTLDSFAINTPIARYENGIGFDVFNYKMKYTEDTHISSEIIIASYIIENGELTFMNRNEDTSVGVNGFEAVSYTYLKEKYAD